MEPIASPEWKLLGVWNLGDRQIQCEKWKPPGRKCGTRTGSAYLVQDEHGRLEAWGGVCWRKSIKAGIVRDPGNILERWGGPVQITPEQRAEMAALRDDIKAMFLAWAAAQERALAEAEERRRLEEERKQAAVIEEAKRRGEEERRRAEEEKRRAEEAAAHQVAQEQWAAPSRVGALPPWGPPERPRRQPQHLPASTTPRKPAEIPADRRGDPVYVETFGEVERFFKQQGLSTAAPQFIDNVERRWRLKKGLPV